MERTVHDLIILGCGGIGSAVFDLAVRRGLSVLAIDQHQPPHDHGSSHGQTRVIRQAYFEHSDYVPLLRRAYTGWADLETRCGEQIYFPTGLLQVAPLNGAVCRGVLASAKRHDLKIDELNPRDVTDRWPGFHVAEEQVGLFESNAGYLLVERCIAHQIQLARAAGGQLLTETRVIDWRSAGDAVEVRTADGARYHAAKLIITAGPWAAAALRELQVPLLLRRRPMFWFDARDDFYRADRGCPVFLFELPQGIFYGFPRADDQGLKVAEHSGGDIVSSPEAAAPGATRGEQRAVERFLASCLPRASRKMLAARRCFYTVTPDEHFLLDHYPGLNQVAFAAGLSGHGYKFAPVLAESLLDLVVHQDSDLPIKFLRSDRPGLGVERG